MLLSRLSVEKIYSPLCPVAGRFRPVPRRDGSIDI